MVSAGACQRGGHVGGHGIKEIGLEIPRKRAFALNVVAVAFVDEKYLCNF